MAVNETKVQQNDEITEENFEELLEASFKKTDGDLIAGKIVDIKDNEVFVDVDRKSEGILDAGEITDKNGDLLFKVGDTINVVITGSRGGKPLLSYKKALRREKIKEFIENFDENAENILNVKVISFNKGGFVCINSDNVEFFMPRSQAGFKDGKSEINKTYKVKIIKINKEEQSIIVSRKKLFDEERKVK